MDLDSEAPVHRPRAGQATRDDVLAAARTLLGEEGPAALSVRRVASAVGVSRQVVYSRFGSMAGLLEALFTDGFERLAVQADAVPGVPGTEDHLLSLMRAYRAHAHAHPAVYGLMFEGSVAGFSPSASALERSRRSFQTIVRAASAWLDRNARPTDSKVSVAVSLWCGVHGIVSLERVGHLPPELAEQELTHLVHRVLRGALETA